MFRYSSIVDTLLKAMTHKYIRRVPKGVTKTGKTKYMYFYAGQEGHGRGIAHESELVEGSSFAFGEHRKTRYHAHISKIDGDKVTVRYDDGAKKGTEETMTKKQFQALVHGEHASSIKQAKEKAERQLKDFQAGKEKGVKVKQETLDKLEQRVKNLDELSKPIEAPKNKPIENIQLSQEPVDKLFTFLTSILKTNPKSLGQEYQHILIDGQRKQILAQTEKTMVLVTSPASLDIDEYMQPGLLSNDFTTNIIKNKTTNAKIRRSYDGYIQENRLRLDKRFIQINQVRDINLTNTITIKLSSDLKNKIQGAIDAAGERADDMTIDIMYPQDGKIRILFKDKQGSAPPELLATVPYTTSTKPSSNPKNTSLSISPRALSQILPYVKEWNMASDFLKAPFVFGGEDGSYKTDIIQIPE